MFGYYRLAAAVPNLRVADPAFNARQIIGQLAEAAAAGAAAVVFPELSVTGYSCGDLFFQTALQKAAAQELASLARATVEHPVIAIVGLPVLIGSRLYNVAAVLQNGRVQALVPKTQLPNYGFFSVYRFFSAGASLDGRTVRLDAFDYDIPAGTDLLFDGGGNFQFGVELCEDLWCVVPPSCRQALNGAKLLFNLAACTEAPGKAARRRERVVQQSRRCSAGYLFASAGIDESSTDTVHAGHALIAANGELLAENDRFQRSGSLIYADIDVDRLNNIRLSDTSFNDQPAGTGCRRIMLGSVPEAPDWHYAPLVRQPFVPPPGPAQTEQLQDIVAIQCAGLAKRFLHTRAERLILGVSGGLDSTLALLIGCQTLQLLELPNDRLLALTLPGFGTSSRTYHNATALCRQLGVELREISIRDACLQHFRDIGHDPALTDTTYENAQARERTQILMDVANQQNGLLLGTGDLSEIALGWSTYNGDHMSMYAVNASIPKTLIPALLTHLGGSGGEAVAAILRDIIDTPVSPELLPTDGDGNLQQKTEELIGPYELHDFFLYHFINFNAEPAKLEALARQVFDGIYPAGQIRRTLKLILQRYIRHQFKRRCTPDGPKAGSISLSPRAGYKMPSDASPDAWLAGLEQ